MLRTIFGSLFAGYSQYSYGLVPGFFRLRCQMWCAEENNARHSINQVFIAMNLFVGNTEGLFQNNATQAVAYEQYGTMLSLHRKVRKEVMSISLLNGDLIFVSALPKLSQRVEEIFALDQKFLPRESLVERNGKIESEQTSLTHMNWQQRLKPGV